MPDEHGNTKADDGTVPSTSQHAYREGREEDVVGDVDKLTSGDPKESQRKEIEGDEDFNLKPSAPDKH